MGKKIGLWKMKVICAVPQVFCMNILTNIKLQKLDLNSHDCEEFYWLPENVINIYNDQCVDIINCSKLWAGFVVGSSQ